jgi:hypothetical protein
MTKEYFHATSYPHSGGDTIRRGTYLSDALNDSAYVDNDPNQEILRERIREANFPSKPSRFNASYVFEHFQDAVVFRDQLYPDRRIYIVSFADLHAPIHRVCYTAWRSDHVDMEQQAHDYWSQPINYSTGSEIFAESDLLVVAEA